MLKTESHRCQGAMKRDERLARWSELGRHFDRWRKLTDKELLEELQVSFPSLVEASRSREECIKSLTMDYVDKWFVGCISRHASRKVRT